MCTQYKAESLYNSAVIYHYVLCMLLYLGVLGLLTEQLYIHVGHNGNHNVRHCSRCVSLATLNNSYHNTAVLSLLPVSICNIHSQLLWHFCVQHSNI